MDNDDRQVGRILTRREILALFGATGTAVLAGCMTRQTGTSTPAGSGGATTVEPTAAPTLNAEAQTSVVVATQESATVAPTVGSTPTIAAAEETGVLPSCIVTPELTEGPYFVDQQLNRSDIRTDPSDGSVKEGVPLVMTLRVYQAGSSGCTPLAGANVDLWHCDALGVYSGVNDRSASTVGQQFLRGYQVTDDKGAVQFTTIYPGWYPGRAVHIHFKVRANDSAGQNLEFTSQFFFDDAASDQVYTQEPYASRGQRTAFNDNDGIFRNGGNQLLLPITQSDSGYATMFDIGLHMT